MRSVKNPARSRPLSRNVRRLMKMARESPMNPEVEKIEREFTARDLAYCDMQGNIFMAAIDRGIVSFSGQTVKTFTLNGKKDFTLSLKDLPKEKLVFVFQSSCGFPFSSNPRS